MRAVTFRGTHQVAVDEIPEPTILEGADAVVRVQRAAICGSDLHLYHGTIPGILPGMTIGHEFVGTVESVGSQVQYLKSGDRVVGTFHIGCGGCPACRRGDFHQCSQGGVLGYGIAFGNLAGSQADFVRIPHADINLRIIPPSLDWDRALFCGDILTTAFGAVKNAGVQPGETVAVIGCGPVGLMVVISALVQGAGRVVAIDRLTERTKRAESLGAVPLSSEEKNPISAINQLTQGEGADVVIEAVGGSKTLEMAFQLVRGGGRISAIGVTAEDTLAYPLMSSLTKDITFRIGVANIHRDIDETLALVTYGRIDPTVIISHHLPLSRAPEGYRLFAERQAQKVLLALD